MRETRSFWSVPVSLAVLRTLALDAALAQAVVALRRGGIEPLLLKGPAIARWLYDDPSDRRYCDVDLLVSADRHVAAGAVLESLGYRDVLAGMRPAERSGHSSVWSRDGIKIDLHRRLSLLPGDPFAVLAERASTLSVGSVIVRVPRPAALAVIIALHAAQHGPSVPAPLEDLRRAVSTGDDATWDDAAQLARRLGVAGAVGAGLAMTEGGAALAARLGLAGRVDPAVRLRIHGASPLAVRLLRLPHGGARRAGSVLAALVPSPAFMRYRDPRARRGPLGMAAAYLTRLGDGATQLPGAGVDLIRCARWRQPFTGLIRGAVWAYGGVHACRGQLRCGPLDSVQMPAIPEARRGLACGVGLGLVAARPSCLERSLVRRAWHLSQGRDRRVVIGVSGPGERFGAHAWLEGDRDGSGLVEMVRWPTR